MKGSTAALIIAGFLAVAPGTFRGSLVYAQVDLLELPSEPQGQWFASNREFFPLRELPPPPGGVPTADAQWTLLILAAPHRPDLLPAEMSARRYQRQLLFRGDKVVGAEYAAYAAGRQPLYRRRVNDGGELQLQEHFTYRPDGTLRSVEHCTAADGCLTARFAPPDRAGGTETIAGDDFIFRLRNDQVGRPVYVRTEQGEAVREEFRSYSDGLLTERRVVENGTTTTVSYRDGLPAVEEVYDGERRVLRRETEYNDRGEILERREVTRTQRIQERWERRADGGVVFTRRENGTVVLREEPGERWETVRTRFRDGEVVLREFLDDGTVVRREIVSDGAPTQRDEP